MPLTTDSLRVHSWTLLVVTDGRDGYLEQATDSMWAMLPGPDRRVMVDDTGDPAHTALLRVMFPDFDVHGREGRRGLAEAVRFGWGLCDTDYVFHAEDDFTYNRPVDVIGMAATLRENPTLSQMCLLRQPWNAEEQAAGGIVEKDPADYIDRDGWLEHRRLFSLNPCLIPRHIYELGWSDGNERGFTDLLLDLGYTFGYWGSRGDPPAVTHIGRARAAGWSL
jgi:hypothetical protein